MSRDKEQCRFKSVCFDLDGTLGDSIPTCLGMFVEALGPYCEFSLTPSQVIEHFGLNEEGIVKRLVSPADFPMAIQRFYELYQQNLKNGRIAPFAGVHELIEGLNRQGVLQFVLTGKGRITTDFTLKGWGLEACIKESRCGEEHKLNKAAHLTCLLTKYNLRPDEMVYVGDAVSDFKACVEAQVPCISALWQPNMDPDSAAYLREHNPGWCMDSFEEAASYLLSHCGA